MAGVRVGHCTVTDRSDSAVQTGVTVVLPHAGNMFREKVVAGCHVINGFGKSVGLLQVEELGQLESPIALTNTLSVPAATEGLLDHLLADNAEIGRTTGSVNPVVAECNDSRLNDVRARRVTRAHVAEALGSASSGPVEQGSVGAGRGMMLYDFKGGVGTASCVVDSDGSELTVGILVLANFGRLGELSIDGVKAERLLGVGERPVPSSRESDGSIIAVVATDAPVTDRQLKRLLRRVQNGIARTGSATASGSGEVAIGFTTAFRIPHFPTTSTVPIAALREDGPLIDSLFTAVTEATEDAVLNALFHAETVSGRDGFVGQAFPAAAFERSSSAGAPTNGEPAR